MILSSVLVFERAFEIAAAGRQASRGSAQEGKGNQNQLPLKFSFK